jgi:HSP20 family protein
MSKTESPLYCTRAAPSAAAGGASDTRWAPNTDVYVTDAGLVIKVEMAGIRREDLEITVEGSRITISGQRPDCCRSPGCRFLMMEINYGHFETIIDLPAGYDLSRAKASYQNGFLRVDVPAMDSAPSVVGAPSEG